mmetsp:Transcript_7397/g.15231  ORF Transcript_7397/g.15231 Transcript_7397/m.15231 type:complete len:329 (+) Transcript_7397:375-1361(+)
MALSTTTLGMDDGIFLLLVGHRRVSSAKPRIGRRPRREQVGILDETLDRSFGEGDLIAGVEGKRSLLVMISVLLWLLWLLLLWLWLWLALSTGVAILIILIVILLLFLLVAVVVVNSFFVIVGFVLVVGTHEMRRNRIVLAIVANGIRATGRMGTVLAIHGRDAGTRRWRSMMDISMSMWMWMWIWMLTGRRRRVMPGTWRRMNQVRIEKGRWDHHGMCHGGGTVETVGIGFVVSDAVLVAVAFGAGVGTGTGIGSSLGSIDSLVVVATGVVIGNGRILSRGTRTFSNFDIDSGTAHHLPERARPAAIVGVILHRSCSRRRHGPWLVS